MINLCKKIAEHIKEYCEAAGIHGPQHIVSQRLTIYERLASYVNLFPVIVVDLYFMIISIQIPIIA